MRERASGMGTRASAATRASAGTRGRESRRGWRPVGTRGWRRVGKMAFMAGFGTAVVGATSASAPAERTEVPLRVEAGHLVVTVTSSEGHALDFLLSTGNAVTVLGEAVADHLGSQTLRLGDVELDTRDPYTLPDDDLVYGGVQLHGIVGLNTLSQYDVLVDAPGGRLVLQSIGPRVEWPGVALSDPIRLRIMHGIVISLDVTVDGHDYAAMLDLGSSAVLVNAGAAATLGIEDRGTATVELGDVRLDGAAVRLSDAAIFERWDPEGNGFVIVGGAIATDCAVSISWVHREMRTCAR